jgi:hypothetical protein
MEADEISGFYSDFRNRRFLENFWKISFYRVLRLEFSRFFHWLEPQSVFIIYGVASVISGHIKIKKLHRGFLTVIPYKITYQMVHDENP